MKMSANRFWTLVAAGLAGLIAVGVVLIVQFHQTWWPKATGAVDQSSPVISYGPSSVPSSTTEVAVATPTFPTVPMSAVGDTIDFTYPGGSGPQPTGRVRMNWAQRLAGPKAPGLFTLNVGFLAVAGQLPTSQQDWVLRDASGYIYHPELTGTSYLAAGEKTSGVVQFYVPIGTYTAEFAPNGVVLAIWTVTA